MSEKRYTKEKRFPDYRSSTFTFKIIPEGEIRKPRAETAFPVACQPVIYQNLKKIQFLLRCLGYHQKKKKKETPVYHFGTSSYRTFKFSLRQGFL